MIKKIFIIAGEPSGDILGAKLMRAIHENSNVEFYGIGGKEMAAAGLHSLFPMEKISLMGFFEIIGHIFTLRKLINLTATKVKEISPDIFISIDSPGFCFRVAAKLQNLNFKLVHYVAPSVWAYKPARATKVAKLYDYVISVLPFEPPYFIREGVFCKFVGHPITEDAKGDSKLFYQKYPFTPADEILCIKPGSRANEINKLLPIFVQTAELLVAKKPDLKLVLTTFEPFVEQIKAAFAEKNLSVTIVTGPDKLHALAASKVALVKSGTSSLEVAYNNIPMVVAYKVNFISALLVKMMLLIPYVSLVNILSGKEVIPELLQNKCRADYLAKAIEHLLDNAEARQRQIDNFQLVFKKLSVTHDQPSKRAARIVLDLMR